MKKIEYVRNEQDMEQECARMLLYPVEIDDYITFRRNARRLVEERHLEQPLEA